MFYGAYHALYWSSLDAYANRSSDAGHDRAGTARPGSPHGFPSNSTLPHWVVRDTMTSATLLPRFGGFTILHTFITFFTALSAVFVGLSLHLVQSIPISHSTFRNKKPICTLAVIR